MQDNRNKTSSDFRKKSERNTVQKNDQDHTARDVDAFDLSREYGKNKIDGSDGEDI